MTGSKLPNLGYKQKYMIIYPVVVFICFMIFLPVLSGVAASWVLVSLCAPFSLVPILLYSGKRGARSPALTFLFYAAYPLHLAALVVIRAMRLVPPHFF